MSDDPDQLFEKARDLLEEECFEEVLDMLEERDEPEALYLRAVAQRESGEEDEARRLCSQALSIEEWDEPLCLKALLHLDVAETEEALRSAERAVELVPDGAQPRYILGLVETLRGNLGRADECFARAAELEPDVYFEPCRLSSDSFENAVEDALSSLPSSFREHLENVEIAIENLPDEDWILEGIEFDVLGIYQGATIMSSEPDFPDRILLFQHNLENISPDRETLLEEIRDTLFHEVAHHMGMDEDAVRQAEDSAQPN